jgi:hypothetical protein
MLDWGELASLGHGPRPGISSILTMGPFTTSVALLNGFYRWHLAGVIRPENSFRLSDDLSTLLEER